MRTDKFYVNTLVDRYPGTFPTLEEYETWESEKLIAAGFPKEMPQEYMVIGTDQEMKHEQDIYTLIEWCIEQDRKERTR